MLIMDGTGSRSRENELFLCLVKRGETVRIPVNSILYIESSSHKLLFHAKDSVWEYNDKLDNILKLLEPEGFRRCHQSFVVRMNAVSVVRNNKLIIEGRELQMSRKYKDSIRQELIRCEYEEAGNRIYLFRSGSDMQQEDYYGRVLWIKGAYIGRSVMIVPEKDILIGRDGKVCDIVINDPRISRRHLHIMYHVNKKIYEVMDVSTNGTYVNNNIRLEKEVRYDIIAGGILQLGDMITELKLC